MPNKKYLIFGAAAAIILILGGIAVLRLWKGEDNWICQNGQWVAHGNPQKNKPSSPCQKEGDTSLGESEKNIEIKESLGDNIRIQLPERNSLVQSPLSIKGSAKGWYFEGSFPVKIINDNGRVVAQGEAHAKGEWMVDDWVPFEAELTFENPATRSGRMIFKNSNPSGLPENDKLFMLPIRFK